MILYKLFRVRKDGSIGPLFINKQQVIPIGVWLTAEPHPTHGFAFRPGWHCTVRPSAPHLSMKGRAWFKVQVKRGTVHERPKSQGGSWVLAPEMMVLERVASGY